MEIDILIISCPLSIKKEVVYSALKDDELLINEIIKFSDYKANNGVETFKQRLNMIVTEEGYYLAVYEDDVVEVED